MKEGDIVAFNRMVPSHIAKKLGTEFSKVVFIDNNDWAVIKNGNGKQIKMIHKTWLKVVKEA